MKQATEDAKKKGKQDKKLKKKLSTIDENSDDNEPKTYEVNDSDEDGGAKKGEDGPKRRN